MAVHDVVLGLFPAAKRDGDGWAAKCPAHDDRRASLSIGTGDDGRTLLHCHAGCSLDSILAAVNLEPRDLFPEKTTATTSTIVATYRYLDEGGAHLFDVVRFEPKDFRQRRADGVWKMHGVRRVLYRLPELQGQTIAYIVEGEKDADRLRAIGLPGTTAPGGAGKWRPAYVEQLKAASVEHVVVLPDNDEPGMKHANDVAASCQAAGLKVKIISLPDQPAKGDVSDWLDAGHTREELVALAKQTALYTPTATTPPSEPVAAPKPTGRAPKREKAEKPKQGRDVQLDDPEPWPEPVEGAALLDTIVATFERYLALPDHAAPALALWVLSAYTFDAFFLSAILAFTSPVKRCGKTLALIVLGALVPRRLFASNVTPAVLFRTIEKYAPTLLIDEADTFIRDNDELRGILNSGHTRTTAVVIRAVGEDFEPRAFSTWCPKAIALIGTLPDTLADRAIEIAMRRRTPGERVERLRQDRIAAECHDVRRQLARWTADHLCALQDADPQVPAALHDRTADCWRPLLALADAVGGSWPAGAREAATGLSRGDAGADNDLASELLKDIQVIFNDRPDDDAIGSTDLLVKLNALADRPWPTCSRGDKPLNGHRLARLLKNFGIVSAGTMRFGTETAKGYRRGGFDDAFARYLGSEASHRHNVNETGPEVAKTKRHRAAECDASEMQVSSTNTGLCDDVTVQRPDLAEADEWEQTW